MSYSPHIGKDVIWVLCQLFSWSPTITLSLFLTQQKKCVTNNVICIYNWHIWWISLPMFSGWISISILSISFILRQVFIILNLTWKYCWFRIIIEIWHPFLIPVWSQYDTGVRPTTKKVKENIGLHGFLRISRAWMLG